MHSFPHLLLASKSPRRQQLLKDSGFNYTFVDIDADEVFPNHLKNEEVCMYLAQLKANHFNGEFGDSVLVTADTIVVINNEVINKPANAQEAFQMLSKLNGNMHEVYTGVCLKTANKERVFYQKSEVYFYPLSDNEIQYYIENYKPFDKSGAYGVQDWMGYVGVEKINGCFYNVMGFPLSKFYREIQNFISNP
ncbi:MAG: septum formation protein Maf [Bacteroidia bacterium]|nr:septum formation protein Maf [Bacteroidia bacterium]